MRRALFVLCLLLSAQPALATDVPKAAGQPLPTTDAKNPISPVPVASAITSHL